MTCGYPRPPIEQLSSEAWQRVEARVFEHLEQYPSAPRDETPTRGTERHRWLTPSAAALALAASAFAVVTATTASGPDIARPSSGASGTPSFETARGVAPESPLPERSDLPESVGSRIATTTGPATTTLGESTLAIANHSELRIEGDDAVGWLVSLDNGSVHFDVAPRGRRPDFVVRSGDVFVKVIGTRFDVTHQRGQTRVAVQEGRVRVERDGHVDVLEAGDSWPSSHGKRTDGRLANEQPESSTPPRRPSRKPTTAKQTSSARRARAQTSRAQSKRAEAARRRAREEQRARQRFELATQLEGSEPRRAAELYGKVAKAGGPWAANALYAEARLRIDRGERETPQRLLRTYLSRYPNDANAADARRLLSQVAGANP
jgi:hypothetical protein